MDKVLSMRVVKKEVRDPPFPPPTPPSGRPHGLGEEEGLLPDVNVPICSYLQLPSGQFTESEEFFVKYKN